MNKICTVCGRPLVLKPGGTKKDGTPYKPFMGCEVWDDEHKKARDAFKAAKSGYKTYPDAQNGGKVNVSTIDPMQIIGDELGAINKRLDDLATYLKSKLN